MYERYPISGIKESYSHVQGTKTVVMPVLIAALLVALVAFYFTGEPPAPLVAQQSPEAPPTALNLTPALPGTGSVETASFVLPAPAPETPAELPAPALPANGLPLVSNEAVSEPDLTPWMSPLSLDTYIRQKNRGFRESFWDRGHWIEAIEGRWHEGRRQFRIAFDTIPDRERFQWYCRIDQTEAEYRDTLSRLRREGYTLVQGQVYERPDKTKRYQGVRHREIPEKPATAELPGILGSTPGLRPLEAGTLHLQ